MNKDKLKEAVHLLSLSPYYKTWTLDQRLQLVKWFMLEHLN